MFIACKFRPHDTRTYTYIYDGAEPLTAGDIVLVAGRNGEGTKQVVVAEIDVAEPAFACKPILEKFVPEPVDQRDLLDDGDDDDLEATVGGRA